MSDWFHRPRRLDKFLGDAGVGTRKALRALFGEGVVRLNGERGALAWRLVDPLRDEVFVRGERVELCRPSVYALMHKPKGRLTARSDPFGRANLGSLCPEGWGGSVSHIGRLDKETTGALMWTDDGDLNWLLTSPNKGIWKRYHIVLGEDVGRDDARLEALRGMERLDGHVLLPVRVEWASSRVLYMDLQEGRYRQVRRMVKGCGLALEHLHRESVGPVEVGDLGVGEVRDLAREEVSRLWEVTRGEEVLRARFRRESEQRLQSPFVTEREREIIGRWLG